MFDGTPVIFQERGLGFCFFRVQLCGPASHQSQAAISACGNGDQWEFALALFQECEFNSVERSVVTYAVTEHKQCGMFDVRWCYSIIVGKLQLFFSQMRIPSSS